MKVAVTDGRGNLWLDDAPEPTVGPFDCLVRMECCAFCNSTDQHIVQGLALLGLTYPAILGHESVGVVIDKGSEVRHFDIGDRVLRAYAAYPESQLDGYHSAWGGFAELGKVTDWKAMREAGRDGEGAALRYQQRVPADMTAEQAALLIPQKEVWSALGGVEQIEGRRILVTGAGIVGLLFGLFAKQRGAEQVTVVARRREALDRVMEQGAADDVRLFDRDDAPDRPYDLMIETTGSLEAAKRALRLVRPGGEIYGYAVYDQPDVEALDGHAFRRIEADEAGVHDEICARVSEGEFDHRRLITHEMPFEAIDEAWRTVTERRTLKTVVRLS